MLSCLIVRKFSFVLWLAAFLAVGVVGAPPAFAQFQRETIEPREPVQPRSRTAPGEDKSPLATPSGAQSNTTVREHVIQDAPSKQKIQEKLKLEDTVYLDLAYGRVVIKLHPELAPNTVSRFKELVRQGFYDGLVWHRVIDGFMAQTGDPKGDGTGGSGQNQNAEFNAGKHTRGALSMARAANINSADSQFFICLADAPHLDGQYTYFGEVVDGMAYVDQIQKGDPRRNGSVVYPDHILVMQVASDAQKNDKAAAIVREMAKTEGPKAK